MSDAALVRAAFIFLRTAHVTPSARAILEVIRFARRTQHADGTMTLGKGMRRSAVAAFLEQLEAEETGHAQPAPGLFATSDLPAPAPAKPKRDPKAPTLPLLSDAQLVAFRCVDPLWDRIRAECTERGTNKTAWKKANLRWLVAMAETGMSAEQILAAHERVSANASYMLFSMREVQRRMLYGGAQQGSDESRKMLMPSDLPTELHDRIRARRAQEEAL